MLNVSDRLLASSELYHGLLPLDYWWYIRGCCPFYYIKG